MRGRAIHNICRDPDQDPYKRILCDDLTGLGSLIKDMLVVWGDE